MNSRVRFLDVESGREHAITLTFPGHADIEQTRISVLAPVGSALIGLAVGDTIEWPLASGRSKRLRFVELSYQPEAAGDPI